MKIYCDGGARGNPGPAASAFVVYAEDSGDIIHKESKFLGSATNNVAEYTALNMALAWLVNNATEEIEIILDSELVKKQMTGEYRIKNAMLQSLALSAKKMEKEIGYPVSYRHTPRAGNPVADALVNKELDSQRQLDVE